MNKGWDDPTKLGRVLTAEEKDRIKLRAFQSWAEVWLRECYRVLVPGGIIKVFSATRTFHRVGAALDHVGFQQIGLEAWAYGCLSEDSEILTEAGWKKGIEVKQGERVACWDPKSWKPVWDVVEETVCYDYDDEAYHITGFTDQLVSKNHRCYVANNHSFGFVLAEDLPERVVPAQSMYDPDGNLLEPHHPDEQSPGKKAVLALCFGDATVTKTHYKGKMWCVKVPTGAFIARRNGASFITGNSGFPKSLNISKALDKMAGAQRKKVALPASVVRNPKSVNGGKGIEGGDRPYMQKARETGFHEIDSDEAVTDEAKQFDGYGTALKPAWEPFLVGRKPE